MANSFWTGGPEACRQGLQRHYDTLITNLRNQIQQSTDETARSELQTELDNTVAEYKRKISEISKLIF